MNLIKLFFNENELDILHIFFGILLYLLPLIILGVFVEWLTNDKKK